MGAYDTTMSEEESDITGTTAQLSSGDNLSLTTNTSSSLTSLGVEGLTLVDNTEYNLSIHGHEVLLATTMPGSRLTKSSSTPLSAMTTSVSSLNKMLSLVTAMTQNQASMFK